jgi:hypothetical protein
LPAISKLYLSITVSGIQIASSVVAGIFPANRIRREQSVNVTATPDQKTGRRKECAMKPLSILDWYRILRAHRQWTIFQSFRYALWLAR